MMLGEENKVDFSSKGIMPWIVDNLVTIIFVVFVLWGFSVSKDIKTYFFLSELCNRIFRNSFLVLSLIIPVLAGLGLNFGIVIGAMSGQAAILLVRYFDIGGMGGFLLCFVIAFFFAAICGYFTGKLYNKTRGQEMIASLIVGFFANGIYQFIFLFVVGAVLIVPATHPMIKPDGVGIRMTVDLKTAEEGGLKYALENIYKIPFVQALLIIAVVIIVMMIVVYYLNKKNGQAHKNRPISFCFNAALCIATAVFAFHIMSVTPKLFSTVYDLNIVAGSINENANLDEVASKLNAIVSNLNTEAAEADEAIAPKLKAVASDIASKVIPNLDKPNMQRGVVALIGSSATKLNNVAIETSPSDFVANIAQVTTVPVVTGIFIIALCIFTILIMKTKLGQDFRSVGQSQHIAEVSGINVDRTRIIATMISIVLAAWGQLIFLQSVGTLNTYGAHLQIGMFSVAALLVGGASTSKASVKNAIFGVILFNAMFIISPEIGKSLFDQAMLGEYFRSFMVYGVIGAALGIYVWKDIKKSKLNVE